MYGQNFLVDKNIVLRSVELGDLKPGEQVVEIGPGLGTLTSALLMKDVKLKVIEKDTHLIPYLNETFPQEKFTDFEIISADATKVDYRKFAEFKIVANLPYAISSILLEKFLLALPNRMVLMVQRELAQRYMATRGKHFSALSIFLQSAYKIKIGHTVSHSCFFPRPKVDSCLLVLERLEKPIIFEIEMQKTIRSLFLNRRKQLKKAAAEHELTKEWFEKLVVENKIKATTRAEEIPLGLWQELTEKI